MCALNASYEYNIKQSQSNLSVACADLRADGREGAAGLSERDRAAQGTNTYHAR